MKLVMERRYEGVGNCLAHAIKFKRRYGGTIWVVWKKGKRVPTFRVTNETGTYGYVSRRSIIGELLTEGRTVKIKDSDVFINEKGRPRAVDKQRIH